jgi:hypothetical protein
MLPLHDFLPGLATVLTLVSTGALPVAAWHDVIFRAQDVGAPPAPCDCLSR